MIFGPEAAGLASLATLLLFFLITPLALRTLTERLGAQVNTQHLRSALVLGFVPATFWAGIALAVYLACRAIRWYEETYYPGLMQLQDDLPLGGISWVIPALLAAPFCAAIGSLWCFAAKIGLFMGLTGVGVYRCFLLFVAEVSTFLMIFVGCAITLKLLVLTFA